MPCAGPEQVARWQQRPEEEMDACVGPEDVECKQHVSHVCCNLLLDYGLRFGNYMKNSMSRLVSQPGSNERQYDK